MTIEIVTTGDAITVQSPYNPDFVAGARRLHGRFDRANALWAFDARDDARVRELCQQVYGTDGTVTTDTVTLVIDLDARGDDAHTLFIAGRQVWRKMHRDQAPRLGEGCVITAGGFESKGGSVANPRASWVAGTTVEVRDVPRAAADAIEDRDGITVVETAAVDVTALAAERARLVARIAEIDAQLPVA